MVIESVVSVAVKTSAPAVVDFTVKVTTPEVLLAPDGALIVGVPGPDVFVRLTVLPDTGLPLASFRVTVIVEMATPLAMTEVGDALTVDCAADTGPAVKVTVAVCVMVIESVVSVAVKTSAPAVVDFTVKVTTPEALLLPEGALMVGAPGPEVFARLTVLPDTGLPLASFRVTVIVEVVLPSAMTEVGDALTVDCAAETGPGVTVIVPESTDARAPFTAWIVAVPTRWPVNVALVPVVLVDEPTRSPLTTPAVLLVNDHVALTLATKLPFASRLMANTVIELPEATL